MLFETQMLHSIHGGEGSALAPGRQRREGKIMGIVSIFVLGFMFVVAVSRVEEAFNARAQQEGGPRCSFA